MPGTGAADSFRGVENSDAAPMKRLFLLAFAALIVVGCTFERRPPVETDGSGADEGADATSALVSARSFLEELQDLRASGRGDSLRRRVHPDAVLLLDGRPLARGGADGGLDSPLLTPSDRSWRIELEDASMPGGAVLFVLRYPGGGAAPVWNEILLVSRDTVGWAVRLLHRQTHVDVAEADGDDAPPGVRDGRRSP